MCEFLVGQIRSVETRRGLNGEICLAAGTYETEIRKSRLDEFRLTRQGGESGEYGR